MNPPSSNAARVAYDAALTPLHVKPLWNVLRSVLTPEPRLRERPFVWRWRDVRPRLIEAGELITAAEAERRVLMFINPESPPQIGATATLYAAMQLILPGEVAPAHRHSVTALRFVVEGEGGYTCVEGSRIDMRPGDLILTPSGMWHDHGNEGRGPVMWLDGLDIPLLVGMNQIFFEDHLENRQSRTEPHAARERLFGRALFPTAGGHVPMPAAGASPVWAYRWDAVEEALGALATSGSPDPHDGYLVRYANPATGGDVLGTIGCRAQRLPGGFETRPQRTTVSAVAHVVRGSGKTLVDGGVLTWEAGDTIALPAWTSYAHATGGGGASLFVFDDAPLLRALGLVRGERG